MFSKFFVSLILFFSFVLPVWGQSVKRATQPILPPELIFTWHANNYFPSNFRGKAYATPHSLITASLEALRNNKLIDLSQPVISWYIDDKFFNKGAGLKEIIFPVSKTTPEYHTIKASLQLSDEPVESSLRIPILQPRIVIHAPYPYHIIKGGTRTLFQALPYFFTISSIQNLDFYWSINQQKATRTNDSVLSLDVGAPNNGLDSVFVELTTLNTQNSLEIAKDKVQLTVSD